MDLLNLAGNGGANLDTTEREKEVIDVPGVSPSFVNQPSL